jgi:hypothetical protein
VSSREALLASIDVSIPNKAINGTHFNLREQKRPFHVSEAMISGVTYAHVNKAYKRRVV